MRCVLHTKGCRWTGNLSDVSAHLNNCPCNVAAILKRAETAEETIKELKNKIEGLENDVKGLEFDVEENNELVIFTYEFSTRKLESLANKIGLCMKSGRQPLGGWNGVYDVIKQAHKDCK